jgi:hypothetical protein
MSGDERQMRVQPASSVVPGLLVVGLLVLGILLRFWRLGDWTLDATEIFTLRDSLHPRFANARPLSYLLNYYLVRPFTPLDEFGLRLLPAVFGALAIPVFYFVNRRLLGTRAALFGTLLLSVSALHVFYSQFARYWSLVFLLCAVYPYALYRGIRERNGRALALGIATGVLAALAHPVSMLLFGGPALWLVFGALRGRNLRRLWDRSRVRWTVALAAVLLVAIALRFLPLLHGWISEHDQNPGSGQFLLRAPMAPGLKQFFYLVAYAEGLTLPLVLAGIVGIAILWQQRDRPLAIFLVALVAFPVAFLTLISVRTPVSTFYLLPTAPVFFMGAGVFLDRLAAADWRLRPRWLVPATVTVFVILSGTPTLISQYRNGRRYDFRGVARWLEPRLAPEDVVYSDQHMVLGHYLPATQVQRLRYDTVPLADTVRAMQEAGRGALWIVAPAPSHALRTTLSQGGLIGWIYEHCRLGNTIGRGRLDFRQQYLQVYDCPSSVPEAAGQRREAAAGSGRATPRPTSSSR